MTTTSIVRLKITLDDVQPVVMRRIAVRFGVRLDRLHTIVQAAMGWTNSHLWEFRAGGTGWGPRDPGVRLGDGPHDASKATLMGVLNDAGGKTIRYLYDFGDGWEHTIKLERIFPDVPGLEQPFLLEAIGRCPPEDIGGPLGYAEFLEAISDKNHERHVEFAERYDTNFDPAAVDLKRLEAAVDAIAQRSQRHSAQKRVKPTKP